MKSCNLQYFVNFEKILGVINAVIYTTVNGKIMDSIRVLAIPFTRAKDQPLADFAESIKQICDSEQRGVDMLVLSEYAWGRTPLQVEDVIQYFRDWENHPILFLGTIVLQIKDKYTNAGIVFDRKGNYRLIGKKNPVKMERSKGITASTAFPELFQSNVIDFGELQVGIVICSDIWDNAMLGDMMKSGMNILVNSSMSRVENENYRTYASTLLHALALSRAREFVIPVVLVDNIGYPGEIATGRATCMVDPSIKHEDIHGIEDVVNYTDGESPLYTVFNLHKIQQYRKYRIEEGLLNYY